jgi:aspartyl protease family protein
MVYLMVKGKLTFYDGVIIEADWLDGNPTGIGSYIEPNSNSESNDGFTMTGPYIDGKITGQGKIEYNTKDVYIGSIKNSSRDGEGTLYYYAGGIKTGKWENGKCINCQSALSTTINLIKLKKEDGVYKIDVFINGIPVNNMIFDTGAGEISISPSFLLAAIENGDLDKSDILEGGNYINADGEINYNARVNLREVKIGNNTIQNIEASICKSCSGKGINLFGLNAIKKLGNSISIDFDKNELRYW